MLSEIRKYYWQDFSLQRTIAMPAVLGIIVLIISLGSSHETNMMDSIAKFAATAYFILVFMWGGYRASNAVIEEVNEKTWDNQRLSPTPPLSLTLGKLFGSTLYTWYGGLIALFIYAFASLYYSEPKDVAFYVALYALSGVFCQAISLLTSLESIRTRNYHNRLHGISFLIAGLVAANLFFSFGSIPDIKPIHWFGEDYFYRPFLITSLVIFLGWSVIGIYRQMREELKFRNIPWVWGCFILFLMVYAKGFVPETESYVDDSRSMIRPWSGIAFIIGAISTYLMLFVDTINVTRYRIISNHARHGHWVKMGETLPRWTVSFLLTLLAGIALILAIPKTESTTILFVITLILFILRDGCILHYFQFSPTPRRAILATLFYLMVLYLLIPILLRVMHLPDVASYFFPVTHTKAALDNVVIAVLQTILALVLVYVGWRRGNKAIQ